MPSSGLQVNYFPSFQALSAIRHADSFAKFKLASGKQHTSCHEVVNKVKNTLYILINLKIIAHNKMLNLC
jgi:hypothetical protein